MKIKLYTSLTGLNNRIEGRKMFVFTKDSSMRNESIDNIVVYIDFEDIESIEDTGAIIIKEKQ